MMHNFEVGQWWITWDGTVVQIYQIDQLVNEQPRYPVRAHGFGNPGAMHFTSQGQYFYELPSRDDLVMQVPDLLGYLTRVSPWS